MLTMYGKEGNSTDIGQFVGYFGAGFAGNLFDQFIKKEFADLSSLKSISLGIGSLGGDLLTNAINFGVKKDLKFNKLGGAVFWQDIINYKSAFKAVSKTALFSIGDVVGQLNNLFKY